MKPQADNDNNLLLWRAETYPHICQENSCHCSAERTRVITACGREPRSRASSFWHQIIIIIIILKFYFAEVKRSVFFFMTRVERPAPEGVLPSHLQHISASPADLQWRNPQRSLFYILNCGSFFVSTGTWQLCLKEFHSKPAEHYETNKTNLFSFLKQWSRPHPWNGSLSSF